MLAYQLAGIGLFFVLLVAHRWWRRRQEERRTRAYIERWLERRR